MPLAMVVTAMLVMLPPLPALAELGPGGTFVDDNGSVHEPDIEAIVAAGITTGCAEHRFCPEDPVTRGQMAAFLHRALDDRLVPGTPVEFTDDDTSAFEADIRWLSGITTGCAPDRYCPDDAVTREQMAAFLVRAFDLPPTADTPFTDVTGTFEDDINRLAAVGITKGCTSTTFCPADPVTREQMASFLVRALGLTPIVPPPVEGSAGCGQPAPASDECWRSTPGVSRWRSRPASPTPPPHPGGSGSPAPSPRWRSWRWWRAG